MWYYNKKKDVLNMKCNTKLCSIIKHNFQLCTDKSYHSFVMKDRKGLRTVLFDYATKYIINNSHLTYLKIFEFSIPSEIKMSSPLSHAKTSSSIFNIGG